MPTNHPVPDPRGRVRRALFRGAALAGAGLLTITALVQVASPAAAAPVPSPGGGSATASTVNFGAAARSPGATALPPVDRRVAEFRQRARVDLPARPASGHRPGAPAAAPRLAPSITSNFDGINQATGCGSCQPPDPNAATSGTEMVETVNTFMQVTTNTGVVLCGGGVTLNRLLRSTDSLTDPRVQYDNANRRFSLAVTVVPASASATPAMWVAASDTADACGTWRVYRLTFSGGPFPAGTFLDFPMFGQDSRALLVSTRNFTPSGVNFTVYGLPKATIYAGATVSFGTFNVASLTAPVSNAGQPIISSNFSYFLAAVPGTGYRLYRLTNSGGSGAVLTLQATISAPFSAPTRQANQPGTTSTLDPSDGNILHSPYFDGGRIWFTHDVDLAGFPTIRYGAVTVSNNTVATAFGFHSGTSDDFNASLAVGLHPAGTIVYLNWAFTDTPAGVATSDVVDTLPAGQAIGNLIGTGTVIVTGSSTGQTRFGDFSSVSIDPNVPGGTCAVSAQQYFAAGGSWRTRVARMGNCQPPVAVPDLTGDTPAQAGQELAAVGLTLGLTTSALDPTCDNINKVKDQSPNPGVQVVAGTAVNITLGKKPPPPFQCE
jgi:PASTA domain-containing protein